MGSIKIFDFFGLTDFLSGILLFFTISPVPASIAQIHAVFLIFKGAASYQKAFMLPMPVYYLGGFADLISATILFIGTPPIFPEYKIYLAGILLLKAIWTSFEMM